MNIRRSQPSESRELRAWIAANHYTKTAPPGYRVALEFLEGKKRIGGMLLGIPNSRQLDDQEWLELTRMFFIDEAPKNTESRALAMMRRWVRVWLPQVKALLAYSDPAVGHSGTVYRAAGWAQFGKTRNGKIVWANRPNRTAEQPSSKLRWVRTP